MGVEARRRKQAAEQEQGKKVRFSEQEGQPNTDGQDVKMRPGEEAGWRVAREGRGYAGLVQGRDDRHQMNGTIGKGKGKGSVGKRRT